MFTSSYTGLRNAVGSIPFFSRWPKAGSARVIPNNKSKNGLILSIVNIFINSAATGTARQASFHRLRFKEGFSQQSSHAFLNPLGNTRMRMNALGQFRDPFIHRDQQSYSLHGT